MKWIKIFEDYNDNDIVTEIQNLSNDYLAYLIDKGFKVIVPWNRDDSCHIFIGNINTSVGNFINFNHNMNTVGIKWSDIKDDIIPFITILKDKYNVNNYIRLKKLDTRDQKVGAGVSYNITLEDIIEDNLEDIDNIYYIRITIELQ